MIIKCNKIELNSISRNRYNYFVSLFLLVMIFAGGCDSYTYNTQARELIDSIQSLLISEKLCNDKNDCSKKEYVLCESSTGVYISIYGIRNQSIVKRIIDLCIDKHAKHPEIVYELHIYTFAKRDNSKNYKSKKAMLQLILNKEE